MVFVTATILNAVVVILRAMENMEINEHGFVPIKVYYEHRNWNFI